MPSISRISVIIPLLDERESLPALHADLQAVASKCDTEWEYIFVDDGSRDGSWTAIRELKRQDDRVRGLRLRRNFGKASALSAGFRAAKGSVVVTLDADLQDDPSEIFKLISRLNDELDVVSGWKQIRHDPWHKVWASRAFNALVGFLTGIRLHDHNCGMKCYRPEVLREIRLYGELHRFIPVLAAARGFRVGEVAVNHRPRRYGRSKYGSARFLRGLLDLMTVKFLTSYSRRPQHLLGTLGLLSFAFGTGSLIYLAITWIIRLWAPDLFPPLHERALLPYAVVTLLFGAQLLSIGFLAELLTAYLNRDADGYSIAEEV